MESNPKELRLENEQGIDRISDLPDLILSKILCYLPTKNAVGTSILSTRWNNLFRYGFMPNTLDFDDSLLLNPRENNSSSVRFIDFVDKLLDETLYGANSVEKVIIKCNKRYGDGKVVTWVRAALRLNVWHLDLKFTRFESTDFFHSLNGCTTLVTLRLWVKSDLYVPDDFSLPSLKNLDLARVCFKDDDDPISQLIESCPVLEYLFLYRCDMQHPYNICIRSPLLKKLVIEGRSQESLLSFTLDAPNLEVLIYNAVTPNYCIVCDFKSLHTAHVNIGPSQEILELEEEHNFEDHCHFNITAMIVSRCSSTIRLYLSGCALGGLHLSSEPLPVFHNLKWLSLGSLHWSILARLLQIAPNLERLTIEEGFKETENGFSDFQHLLPIPPECLVFHMKTIEFWVFEGADEEIKLVEYFLKNGGVLQKLILRCLPFNDMSILTRLLMFPRLSKTCQIDC